jgi:HAD superfamily hydrolase (TIGR01509 family)
MLLIWDYFGVIAQDAFWYTADRIAQGKGMSEQMHEMQHKADLGQISWDEYCQAVSEDIGVSVEDVKKGYQKHDIKQHNILAIRSLPEHTHVLLSNASAQYLKPIMADLGLDSLFSDVFVSSEIGYAKPDSRAYLHVLDTTGFSATSAIMIDDNARNIDSAVELGMKGIIFEPGKDIVELIAKLSV